MLKHCSYLKNFCLQENITSFYLSKKNLVENIDSIHLILRVYLESLIKFESQLYVHASLVTSWTSSKRVYSTDHLPHAPCVGSWKLFRLH